MTTRAERAWAAVPLLVLALGFALVAVFDLFTDLPLHDEWIYRWPVQELLRGHGFHLWPGVQPFALVQLLATWAMALAGLPPRAWRLIVLPFAGLAAYRAYRLTNRLGGGPFWAGTAACLVLGSPLALEVSTGLMSDIFYVALELSTIEACAAWLDGDGGLGPMLAWGGLAALQRQHGVVLPVALGVTLLVCRAYNPARARGPLVLGVVTAAGAVAPFVAGVASPAMGHTLSTAAVQRLLPNIVGVLAVGPSMLALLLLPVVPALVRRRPEGQETGRAALLPFALGVGGAVAALVFAAVYGTMIFPGDEFRNTGLGDTALDGRKVALIPFPVFVALEVTVVVGVVLLFCYRRRSWVATAPPAQVLLLLAGLAHCLPMALTSSTDRYFLAVVAPIAPVVAAIAARTHPHLRPDRAMVATAGLMFAGVLYFAAGEQDYLAWQVARDRVARLAYADHPVERVNAGYEANAIYMFIPALRAGRDPDASLVTMRVRSPEVDVVFARLGDPRPGADYWSLASGRLVIATPSDSDFNPGSYPGTP